MKRKNLKAYVRLDKSGQPIGGSMIYRDKQPYGKFKPLLNPYGDVCCPPLPQGCANTQKFGGYATGNNLGGVHHAYDNNCNTYFLYWLGESEEGFFQSMAILKRDENGTLLWNKRLSIPSTGSYSFNYADYMTMEVDPVNGRLYTWNSNNGLLCMDLDGNVLYYKMLNNLTLSDPPIYNGQIAPGKFGISPDGNFIYVTMNGSAFIVDAYRQAGNIVKIDAATGNIVKQVQLNLYLDSVGFNQGFYGADCDANGNVYASVSYFVGAGRGYIIKYDADLNEVWRTSVMSTNLDAPRATSDGVLNAYYFGSSAIVKLDGATGNVAWNGVFTSVNPDENNIFSLDIRIDANNNIYAVGTSDRINTPYATRQPLISKVLADGSAMEFAYRVNDTTGSLSNYWGYSGIQGPNVIGNSLIAPYYSFYTRPTPAAVELKLGLEDLTGASGGPFVVTNAIHTWVTSPFAPFIGPSLSTSSVQTYLAAAWDTVPCTTIPSPVTFTVANIN